MRVVSVLSFVVSIISSFAEENDVSHFVVYSAKGREPREYQPEQDLMALSGFNDFVVLENLSREKVKEDKNKKELEDTVSKAVMNSGASESLERGDRTLLHFFPFNKEHDQNDNQTPFDGENQQIHEPGSHEHQKKHHDHPHGHEHNGAHEKGDNTRRVANSPLQENQSGSSSSLVTQQYGVDQTVPLFTKFPFSNIIQSNYENGLFRDNFFTNNKLEKNQDSVNFNVVGASTNDNPKEDQNLEILNANGASTSNEIDDENNSENVNANEASSNNGADQNSVNSNKIEDQSLENINEIGGATNSELKEDQSLEDINVIGVSAAAEEDLKNGRKCIDKVMMVQETVYDEVITCDHSYDQRCHTSYVTKYESQQQEECEENFKKSCFIEYAPVAYNEMVEICRTPIVKDCEVKGETKCQTVYESECWTKQLVNEVEDDVTKCKTVMEKKCEQVVQGFAERNDCIELPVEKCIIEKQKVKKYTPMTGCEKVPRELCAPAGCGYKNGTVICHDKMKTVVVDKPQEECSIEPVQTCNHVTKLVPKLVPVQDCVDVPKEVCARSKINPRFVKKPVIKKWCYTPSKESGLA